MLLSLWELWEWLDIGSEIGPTVHLQLLRTYKYSHAINDADNAKWEAPSHRRHALTARLKALALRSRPG